MMQFKTLKFAGIAAIATSLFTACTEENHAGVLTETESGTTIASIVRDEQGEPVASAKVNLISATHIAARMAPIKTTTTDEDGKYSIDSISAGDYALQISNTDHTQSAYQMLTVKDSKTDLQTLNVPEAKLEENASLELDLGTYDLDKGDTLCITGTLNCTAVSESDLKSGTVKLSEIPPAEFTNIILIRGAGRDTSTRNVKWDFTPGEKLEVSSEFVTVTVPEEALSAAKKLNGNKTLESMIVPVTIPTKVKNPVLIDNNGDSLAVFKAENDADSSLYFTAIPSIDAGTYKFTVTSSESVYKTSEISRVFAESKSGLSVTEGDFMNTFITDTTSNSLGISFWIEEDGSKIAEKDSSILDSKENDVTYRLETGKNPEQLCANFYRRVSKDTTYRDSDTVLVNSYCHDVLDGTRHHYVMYIKANHIVIAIDGKTVEDTKMKNAFIMFPGFAIGNHKLTNLTVFSLKQSAIAQADDEGWERLQAWLSAYYLLQK
ncbi:carboxypeptidase-like regulatory domain-containing protein [Fibrobacter sp. UWB12]|uniref:carboxypeptidase-like regulatory domain-containing protein n=1 Tax=Fibrobacter sp. UWB12 TaxID=1896203 RepID=UPI0009145CB4|nr:carboxypeptidase-like regulatory domain-containing protein [Fibrobacter sp. UWB12]SHK42070.1 Carboxypeptidase regulatory-like domain-containing protein [Fibrobacter sp. UWB12]